MSELTYSHKLILWRLAKNPGMIVERAGFNSRATVLSLAKRGYVRLEPPDPQPDAPYTPKAYLTQDGESWIQDHPDRVPG